MVLPKISVQERWLPCLSAASFTARRSPILLISDVNHISIKACHLYVGNPTTVILVLTSKKLKVGNGISQEMGVGWEGRGGGQAAMEISS